MWQPTCNIETLTQRAAIIQQVRAFFYARNVLEVETPCLSYGSITDPHIQSIAAIYINGSENSTLYLQTSPEYHMKRLLAAGSSDIFQICKSFRNGEAGRLHNPEFSMLEWYRLGFNDYQLMDETDTLVQSILHCQPAERYSYQTIFETLLQLDPYRDPTSMLRECALDNGLNDPGLGNERDAWLILLFSFLIEPTLQAPTFIYDFPASQAALARIKENGCAARFELYIQGIELANGFHELTNPVEQAQRFASDQQFRKQHNLPARFIDQHFLNALQHGLPECAGIALGLDRLIMLALQKNNLADVLSFTIANA